MNQLPPQDPPQPIGRRAIGRTVWRYGDSQNENARVIRNVRGAYNALIRVDAVRWRVLAGTWDLRPAACQAAWAAHFRHM